MNKFLPFPKSVFDIEWLRLLAKKINALLNGKVVDVNGNPAGEIKYGEGNTLFIVNPGIGNNWQTPNKELDPSLSVRKGSYVYISALNPIAVIGMTDIVSSSTVISCQGIWQAAKDVPAAVSGSYNVPIFPYPSGMGVSAPTGSPLTGDLDSNTIFWIYWGEVAC